MKISIIIGLMIGAMAFPMIFIPLTGIGIIVWGFYVLFHNIIMPNLHHHNPTE